MKAKCQKALNLLRVVAHTDWGADRKVLLHLYRTIVRSKLDYCFFVYGSARESYLKTLDTIHHQGIRLALGAFRTSPADSLLVEANEPSLNDRREKLSLQFALKLKSNRSNPTYNTVFRPNNFTLFQNKPNAIPTFGIRIAPTLNSAGIKVRNTGHSRYVDFAYLDTTTYVEAIFHSQHFFSIFLCISTPSMSKMVNMKQRVSRGDFSYPRLIFYYFCHCLCRSIKSALAWAPYCLLRLCTCISSFKQQ